MDGRKSQLTLVLLTLTLLALSLGSVLAASTSAGAGPASPAGSSDALSEPAVVLQAASGATLRFKTQNGEGKDGLLPDALEVPHLVLRRNGALTDPEARTLAVEVTGIEVPPAGVTVTLSVETQHGDPDLAADPAYRIPVWRESRWLVNTTGVTQTGVAIVLQHEFDDRVMSGGPEIATPTDYFRWDLVVTGALHPATQPLYRSSREYAFLMENQWTVPLPEVREASAGATPDELIVYYCDMFPFRNDARDPGTWLRREEVAGYVRWELIPAMVDAFRTQTGEWGFPWYDEWTGHRPGQDSERLSVALAATGTWFHGKAPDRGNAAISINVSRGMVGYDTLTDGLMSTFHHELFHNQQRNIYQHYGGSGGVGGLEDAWDFFSEGLAVLASSVGQPGVQLSRTWGSRAYILHAGGFMGIEGISEGDLNQSYGRMEAYHAAPYWRFLYEQCGGMATGVEDPATGMGLIRRVLQVLYRGDVVDVGADTGLVTKMPEIMDRALGDSPCPFSTYGDSLSAFARAIYGLRLEGGRCTGPGFPVGCGFYDPLGVYPNPPVSTIAYTGTATIHGPADQRYPAKIPSSFGIDFVDVVLDPGQDGQSLVVEFHGAPGSGTTFAVQAWRLLDPADGSRPRPVAAKAAGPEFLGLLDGEGRLSLSIPELDTAEYDRLGLLITRTDASESSDPTGAYTIVLRPDV